jgi:tetratricopeptide (TPR) repeat protein
MRAALVVLALFAVPGVARADAAASREAAARAVALNDEASALYEQGHYRAAADKLEEAIRLDPNGKDLVYNLAVLHEKLADLDEAIALYRRYLDTESDPRSKTRVQATLRRLEGARRERDERRGSAAGPRVEGALAPPPPAAPARPLRPWVLGAGGLAAVSLALSASFGMSAVARDPGASPRTGDGVTAADLAGQAHTAHAHAVVADATLIIGLIAAGAATTLYLTTPRSTPTAALAPRLAIAPGSLALRF